LPQLIVLALDNEQLPTVTVLLVDERGTDGAQLDVHRSSSDAAADRALEDDSFSSAAGAPVICAAPLLSDGTQQRLRPRVAQSSAYARDHAAFSESSQQREVRSNALRVLAPRHAHSGKRSVSAV
jgi:hypothetical protein